MKIVLIIIALALLIGLYLMENKKGNASKHPAIHSCDSSQLREILTKSQGDSSLQFVDVRTSLEYSKAHIQPAVNIDVMSNSFTEQFSAYDRAKPLYLYCRSGSRSGKAARKLAQEGFTEIFDLDGGILQWNKSN